MPIRTLNLDGRHWRVFISGWITEYDRDEFALAFVAGSEDQREVRVVRYSPTGARTREASLAEMSDADLERLFRLAQASATSPEANYSA
jgi:hypothetical protein